jgi:hypothetical protein
LAEPQEAVHRLQGGDALAHRFEHLGVAGAQLFGGARPVAFPGLLPSQE